MKEIKYIKTVNVTNTKNVLVQIPAWVTKLWGLNVGDKLEVVYDVQEDRLCISLPIYSDVPRRSEATGRG